ncbi:MULTISPECIES: peptidylprolyl isomerase [unclassified Myroides]|uniref:peptidylprolyl isomerase n=1 Tax=unclassified Myroides TaxID=2642485 RepID=UPI0031013BB6
MAVLSKIRQKSALLIAVIGIALLAFVIGDVVRSTGGGLSRNVGSINGEEINTQEFLHKVAQAEKNGQMSNTQASVAVWNSEVNNILLTTEFEKLGLRIGKDQLVNVVKNNPNFANNPEFLNQLGQFDVNKFNQFVLMMKQAGQEQWNAWLAYEKELEKVGLEQMYFSLIQGGIYTTQTEAKASYLADNSKVSFDYVTVPYSTVNNEEAAVSDAAIIDYMKKHENRFKSETTRELQYAFLASKPSDSDKDAVKETIESLLQPRVQYNAETKKNDTVPGFKTIKDVESFVNTNSDIKFDSLYYAKKDLPLEYQEELFNLQPGQVFGPYVMGDYYCVSRLLDKKPGQRVDAAHILITYAGSAAPGSTRTKEEAKAKAEEILKKVQEAPATFAAVATVETEDPGSKNNGGKYEDIPNGQMVKPFNDFIFNNPAGKIGLVETDFGYHVIQVINKKEGAKLATVALKIEVSDATADELFTKATTLEQDAASASDFIVAAKGLGFDTQNDVTVRPFEEFLPGVGNQRSIVAWAFNKETKDGTIKRFDNADGHIIVKLTSKNDTGLMPIEEVKPFIEPILMNEKKAQIIKQKMTGKTIEEVSTSSKASIASVSEVSLNAPLITNIGNEPLVVGTAFATAVNQNSNLIDGVKGVYMVKTKNVANAPELPNYNSYKAKVENGVRNMAQMRVMKALKDNAKIKDNRIGVIQ